MSNLEKGLYEASGKLFEGSLSRALDVVLSLEGNLQNIPVLDSHTGEPEPESVRENSPLLGIMHELANELIESENAAVLAGRYEGIEPELIKGIGFGFEIAVQAISEYVTGIKELEEQTKE